MNGLFLFLGPAQLLCHVDTKQELHPQLSFIMATTSTPHQRLSSTNIYSNTWDYYHYECMEPTFQDNLWLHTALMSKQLNTPVQYSFSLFGLRDWPLWERTRSHTFLAFTVMANKFISIEIQIHLNP